MYTTTQLELLRSATNGALIPGIDTTDGNPIALPALRPLKSLSTAYSSSGIYYSAATNTVCVTQAGAVLNGYNFGTAEVMVQAANVTIKNCTFVGSSNWYAIDAVYAQGLTVTNCTFIGDPTSKINATVAAGGSATITNNKFINTPNDGIDMSGGGLISGNYFSGAGNDNGQHADAIWINNSPSTPTLITNNFIDWSYNPAATMATVNDCVRITGEVGPVSNVTVTGNYLFGGASSVQAISVAGQGALSNISITNNYIGFAQYYTFYPGSTVGVTETGNIVYDWTNTAYSTNAWTAYQAAGLPTQTLVTTSNGSVSAGSTTGPVTIYGGGVVGNVFGGAHENNIVGGFGYQNIWCNYGANVFTYLAVSDSAVSSADSITNFDPAKDVIDLSRVASNTAALLGVPENLTFIGSAAFDGLGAEVRTQQNANGTTSVQVALAGDTTAAMQINLAGHFSLTAANFALTTAQSATDMAEGAALNDSILSSTSWPLDEYLYTNVQGRAYSSYASIQSGSYVVMDDLNFSATSGEIDIFGPSGQPSTALIITKGDGKEYVTNRGTNDSLTFHQTETIEAGNAIAPEMFVFSSGWGKETINGFATSGANADYLQLSASAFSYLTPGMTQTQELAAVLLNASSGVGGTTINDSHGDSLTLAGISAATLSAHPGLVTFF